MNQKKTEKERRKAAELLLVEIRKNYTLPPPNQADINLLQSALEEWRPTVRPNSYRAYKGKLDDFIRYLQGRGVNRNEVKEFMAHYAKSHALSSCHQCYRSLKLIFDRAGLKHLVEGLHIKKGNPKPLRYFQTHQAQQLKEYISKNNPELWLWCQFVYFSFTRPRSELRLLQVKHIFFEERKILIPGEISKNKKSQFIAIPDAFYPQIVHFKKHAPAEYLFPSPRLPNAPIGYNTYGRQHRKILEKLGFDREYAVYSWKHTGAVNAVKAGISIKDLQIQLRHHSLDMVDKYLWQLGVDDMGELRDCFPGI